MSAATELVADPVAVVVGMPVASPDAEPADEAPDADGVPTPEAASDFCHHHGLDASSLPSATDLELQPLTDEAVGILAHVLLAAGKPPPLQRLTFTYTKRLANIAPLVPALTPELVVLDMSGPAVGRGKLSDLTPLSDALAQGRLPNLEMLLAPQQAVDDASVEALAAAVAFAPKLLRLDLMQNAFGAEAAIKLVKALRGRQELLLVDPEYLDARRTLASHELTDADAELLAATISAAATPPAALTKKLDLSNNKLTDGGCIFEAIAASLPDCEILSLASNNLAASTFAAAALSKALGSLKHLRTLDLSNNEGIGDGGMATLCDGGLKEFQSLRYLHLNAIGMTDTGAEALSAALASGSPPPLRELKLSRNHIGDPGLAALALALTPALAANSLSVELVGNDDIVFSMGCCGGVPPGLKALRAAAKASSVKLHLKAV